MRTILSRPAALAALALLLLAPPAVARTEPKLAAGGKTQVVARAAGREITLGELRAEMARLGLSAADPAAERTALGSILDRAILAEAAKKAALHRRPEAIARVRAAEDQALAELFLAYASQPADPTRADIDDYVRKNPSLFAERRAYDFSVLTLPTAAFDEKALTPLFDSERDFSALAAHLDARRVAYSIAPATQSAVAFPKPIREQLGEYSASDNIVVKGDDATQIMKIIRVRKDAGSAAEWPALARRMILEEEMGKRAEALMARLRREAQISYYRLSAAPAPAKDDRP